MTNATWARVLLLCLVVCSSLACRQPGAASGEQSFSLIKSEQVFEPKRTNKLALDDLDGDGDLDVVFANFFFNPSRVWLNDGSGRFTVTPQELMYGAHGVALGDLDGDGDADLLLAGGGFTAEGKEHTERTRIYLNDGAARFEISDQEFLDGSKSCTGVQLADVDGDGDLDAALVFYDRVLRPSNEIWLNDGNASFALSDLTFPSGAIWGDWDNDGDVDLFYGVAGVGYHVGLNDGTGKFAEQVVVADPQVARGGADAADVDRDGDLDIVTTSGDRETQQPTRVLLNDSRGGFTDSGQTLPAVVFGKVGLGDLDGDGSADAVIFGFEESAGIWLNDGRGRLVDSGIRLDQQPGVNGVRFGDLDGDGDLDLFFAHFRDGPNEIYFNGTR